MTYYTVPDITDILTLKHKFSSEISPYMADFLDGYVKMKFSKDYDLTMDIYMNDRECLNECLDDGFDEFYQQALEFEWDNTPDGDYTVEYTIHNDVFDVVPEVSKLRPGNTLFHHLVDSLAEFLEVGLRDITPGYYSAGAPTPTSCARSDSPLLLNTLLLIGGVQPNPGPNGRGPSVRRKPKQPYRRNGNGRNRANGRSPSGAGTMWLTPKGYGAPDAMRIKLRYIVPLAQLTGGGTTNSFRFTSNAYDVDSALGSTAMAYFAELAVIYSRFRTIHMKYCFDLENQEAFPAQYIVGFMTNSLGSTAVGANYAGNRFMRQGIVSPVNGSHSTRRLTGNVAIASLFGDKGAYYDDLYTGSTTSSTLSSSRTANLYIGTVAAAVPVNGQFVSGWIELDLILDRRNALIV